MMHLASDTDWHGIHGEPGCTRMDCGRSFRINGHPETVIIHEGGFRHGVCDDRWDPVGLPWWVSEALQPCPTCLGLGKLTRIEDHLVAVRPCPGCHKGWPVLTGTTDCPTGCSPADHLFQGGIKCYQCGGTSEVPVRYVILEALPVVAYGTVLNGRYIVVMGTANVYGLQGPGDEPAETNRITLHDADRYVGHYAIRTEVLP